MRIMSISTSTIRDKLVDISFSVDDSNDTLTYVCEEDGKLSVRIMTEFNDDTYGWKKAMCIDIPKEDGIIFTEFLEKIVSSIRNEK